eukprot:Blabericola_migrator_1__5129@NODE_264_length_10634_cov_183_258446_g220_i0_p5_GENE_NODE_264_length_10634_cov_183_258446_g220_i0NODE_264_length_10634_cov_183_258446_g220_i0_p5_ORF_typecomplete_len333_score45_67_NODE_264_length_10634_cov_183_258446_g220_i052446242
MKSPAALKTNLQCRCPWHFCFRMPDDLVVDVRDPKPSHRKTRTFQAVVFVTVVTIAVVITNEVVQQRLSWTPELVFESPILRRLADEYGSDAIDLGALYTWISPDSSASDKPSEFFMKASQAFYTQTKGVMRERQSSFRVFCPEEEPVQVNADKEMGYSLESYLGQAYFLHLLDCLNGTTGFPGTLPFFFFNPSHAVFQPGIFKGSNHLWLFDDSFNHHNPFAVEWGRMSEEERKHFWNPLRTYDYPLRGLLWPPFHEFYANDFLAKLKERSGKDIAVVSAKHYTQWSEDKPLNTFSRSEDLQMILNALLSNDYIVIYNRQHHLFKGDVKVG